MNDSATYYKKFLAGKWLLTNCGGYDTVMNNGVASKTTFSYDTSSHILTVRYYADTFSAPRRADNYLIDSMVLNMDSSGYYILTEVYSLNGAATSVDSALNTWTYVWTNDSSSMLLLNPYGVTGNIFSLSAGGFSSSSGNLIVQSLDSTQMVLAAKNTAGFNSSPLPKYEHTDVRYTFKKQ